MTKPKADASPLPTEPVPIKFTFQTRPGSAIRIINFVATITRPAQPRDADPGRSNRN